MVKKKALRIHRHIIKGVTIGGELSKIYISFILITNNRVIKIEKFHLAKDNDKYCGEMVKEYNNRWLWKEVMLLKKETLTNLYYLTNHFFSIRCIKEAFDKVGGKSEK